MDELGELLELLYDARRRFGTARGVLLRRHSTRLTMEAMKREQARQKHRRGGGELPDDVREEATRAGRSRPTFTRSGPGSGGRRPTGCARRSSPTRRTTRARA